MPIVVRELIVRARVEEANATNRCVTPSENGSNAPSSNTEAIVALCVEKVMEAIDLKKER